MLHIAAKHGRIEIIEGLLKHNANPYTFNASYQIPIDLADDEVKQHLQVC